MSPRLRARRGQIVPLVVLMLPVILACLGLAVDTSNVLLQKQAAQNAADLASLAASADLPDSPASARSLAQRFASSNHFANGTNGVTVTTTTPFKNDANSIGVTVQDSVPMFFLRLLGVHSVPIEATAVASRGGQAWAVFTTGNGCGTGSATWSGAGDHVVGPIHSNGSITTSGANYNFGGPITYACSFTSSGSGNNFGSPPPQHTEVDPTPFHFAPSDFPCTYDFGAGGSLGTSGPWWVGGSSSSRKLNPGVYCSSGTIAISGSGISGNVTFVVGQGLALSGSSHNFSAYLHDVVLYVTGSGSASMSGAGGQWTGYFYAPNASVTMSGAQSTLLAGGIIAKSLTVSGAGWAINSAALNVRHPQLVH